MEAPPSAYPLIDSRLGDRGLIAERYALHGDGRGIACTRTDVIADREGEAEHLVVAGEGGDEVRGRGIPAIQAHGRTARLQPGVSDDASLGIRRPRGIEPDSDATVRALTLRVALSIGFFVLLMIAYATGLLTPHGISP